MISKTVKELHSHHVVGCSSTAVDLFIPSRSMLMISLTLLLTVSPPHASSTALLMFALSTYVAEGAAHANPVRQVATMLQKM